MTALILLLLESLLVFSLSTASPETCLSNGKQYKLTPSAEPGLRECQQYSKNACCSPEYLHANLPSPFPWDQCGPLSHRCKAQISRVECMYLCSPHISEWGDPESASGLNKLPLCIGFCNQWLQACKDDFICQGDPTSSANCSNSCVTFAQAFSSSMQLCDTIWDNSFATEEQPNLCITPQNSLPIEPKKALHKRDIQMNPSTSDLDNTEEGPSGSSEFQNEQPKERMRRALQNVFDLDNIEEGPSGLSDLQNDIPIKRTRRALVKRNVIELPTTAELENAEEGPSGSSDLQNYIPIKRTRRALVKRNVIELPTTAELENAEEGPSGSSEFQNEQPKERMRRALQNVFDLDNIEEGPSGSSDLQNDIPIKRTRRALVKRNVIELPTTAELENAEEGPSGSSDFQNEQPKERMRRALQNVFDLDNIEEGPSGSSELKNSPPKDRTRRALYKRSVFVDLTASDTGNTEEGPSGSSELQNVLPTKKAGKVLRKRNVFLEEVEGSGSSI
ncbi:uncharacterized protein LOC134603520 isoform X2 [Pelobates fuscus]|uniref:uncharacterized protein LOC134603520 isoform X2 n=1 Tax=Pelobates fuscus TaxID=191477 RepID=UPI002FE4E6C4